jgi:hypothetical protein
MAVKFQRSHGIHTTNSTYDALRRDAGGDSVTDSGRRARRLASNGEIRHHGVVDRGGLCGKPIVLEKERGGQDCRGRIGFLLASYVWR